MQKHSGKGWHNIMQKHTKEQIRALNAYLGLVEIVLLIIFTATAPWPSHYKVLLWFGWVCLSTTVNQFRRDYWE